MAKVTNCIRTWKVPSLKTLPQALFCLLHENRLRAEREHYLCRKQHGGRRRGAHLQISTAPYQEAILDFSNWLPQPSFGTSGESTTSFSQDTVLLKHLPFLFSPGQPFSLDAVFTMILRWPLFSKLPWPSCNQSLALCL